MRKAAHRYGGGEADETTWAITGLLHDADYDRWPEEHPSRVVAWLREREEAIAPAVAVHMTAWGMPCESALDRGLIACDELTGFVVARCLVRPDGIVSQTPSSVEMKLEDKVFAPGGNSLEQDLPPHTIRAITALARIATPWSGRTATKPSSAESAYCLGRRRPAWPLGPVRRAEAGATVRKTGDDALTGFHRPAAAKRSGPGASYLARFVPPARTDPVLRSAGC